MYHENEFDRKLTDLTLSHVTLKIMICVFCFYFCVSFPTSDLNLNIFSVFYLDSICNQKFNRTYFM